MVSTLLVVAAALCVGRALSSAVVSTTVDGQTALACRGGSDGMGALAWSTSHEGPWHDVEVTPDSQSSAWRLGFGSSAGTPGYPSHVISDNVAGIVVPVADFADGLGAPELFFELERVASSSAVYRVLSMSGGQYMRVRYGSQGRYEVWFDATASEANEWTFARPPRS
eukprot:m51a1_g6000 hypothetical protein (168) ;mRNA; f:18200-19034